MSKALVMGASGFLGSHVVKELVSAGRDVRIMVRSTSDTSAIDHLNVERCVGDITDEQLDQNRENDLRIHCFPGSNIRCISPRGHF